MPFCPSLPWCFPIRELPFEQEQQEQKQQQQQQEVFCCREVIFSMMFSNFGPDVKVAKSHSSSKRKRSQKHHFLSVSEVTLGIFEVSFWGFSVLQRHGVLLLGGDFFYGVFPFADWM